MLNLREYRNRPALLADYLPWACLVAPGVVLNKDGSFQRSARFRGPDLESATQGELVATCARINNVLRRFGSGWALFFEAERHPARDYPQSEFPDPVLQLVEEERRAAFEGAGTLFESGYVLTLTFLPPVENVGRASEFMMERTGETTDRDYHDHLRTFNQQTDQAFDLLGQLMPEFAPLNDQATLTYLHTCISSKRHPIMVPEVPAYLDAILVDTPFTGGFEPMLGDAHLRTLTILGFPGTTTPGLLDELNHLGFDYRWMTRFIAMDKAEAEKVVRRYRRQWFAKRKSITAIIKEVMTNEQSALVDSDADNKAADADAALQELGADLVSYGYVTTTFTMWDRDPDTVCEKVRAVQRIVDGRGFATIEEGANAVEAWLSSLPGHVYANVRQAPISTLNLAHLMPLSAIWAGPARNKHLDGPPLISVRTNGTTPFRLVTHIGDVGHTLVVGPTGAGKSVLLSLIALQFRRYRNAQVTIFDKGGSARAAVLGMGGNYFDLGSEGALAFQPLANIDLVSKRSFALEWIIGLLVHEGVPIMPDIKDAIWSALSNLAAAPQPERTLTGLTTLLQRNDLRQALQPYTLEGPYGRLLDADEDRLKLGAIQCFEMEELMHETGAVLPALTYLFHRLEEKFDGSPALLILDEAWLFLDNPAFAARIREWLKTLRKQNVSVIFATQGLSDIAGSSIAPAIIESCPSRIFLPNDRAVEPQSKVIYEAFGLNDRQIEIISRAVPKRDYYYQSRQGNRLFELGLGPVALAFTGASTKQDHALMDELIAAHGEEEFADSWLRAKGMDWAADLITSQTQKPTDQGDQL
ncbi:conjugal transfer protein TrbE [Mariluticola halotolerans]|uniref:conjugal transfer protein TrbE n=1 Tax=Mariluticola halotolerans TaxID=2909283 RepID=UPI0026E27DCE|nr:conjugal transfer protein TrbE [Mariluticola halotolerans]UJQ94144.1 conjugal transfer protein TrbE [Mariluticola halotolerans]